MQLSRFVTSQVPLNLTLRHDKLKPLLSNSYTYHFLLELSTKQPPAALGTKLLLSAIFSGLVSMNLFYASSRKFYNEYLLYKTISNGHESEFDMAEDLIVPRPQALERHNEILQSTVFESKYYVVCDKQEEFITLAVQLTPKILGSDNEKRTKCFYANYQKCADGSKCVVVFVTSKGSRLVASKGARNVSEANIFWRKILKQNNLTKPAPLAPPPQLYRSSQSALVQASNQTLSPISTAHHQISPSVSRTHQNRQVRGLDISPSTSDRSDFLLPLQTGVSSSTISNFSQPLFSPSLNSPLTPRKPYPGISSLIYEGQRVFIQRRTLTEIQIFTNIQNHQLKFICSGRVISPYDLEAWEAMLSNEKFPTTNSGQDAYDVDIATVSLAIEFASNNTKTANFNALLLHALSQMHRVIDPEFHGEVPIEAYNSLFLLNGLNSKIDENKRVPIELDQKKLVIDPKVTRDTRLKAEQLMDGLLTVILKLDPTLNASTYEYYQESLNTLLVLLSAQIHQSNASQIENNYFLNILLTNFSELVNNLTKRLVTNFIEQKPLPPASTSMRLVGVVYNAYTYLFPSRSSATLPSDPPPIAERSLLMLLLLSVQCRIPDEKTKNFREGIRSLKDAQEICLLLYLFMIENEDFRVYVLSRLDPEILLLQILRLLYDGIDSKTNYSQMYILLTIILLFSQDEVFNENIQKIHNPYKENQLEWVLIYVRNTPHNEFMNTSSISNITIRIDRLTKPWFTERFLKSISLGGLTYLVLIRIIQFNLSSHQDVYFHNNCLAIMANLGNSIQDIHPYVAQRLVNMFDIVAKRYQKLLKKAQQQGDDENSDAVAIYGDLVSLVLEIINSVLTRRLNSNPELIYSLLHKKDLFTHFQLHPKFSELIANIDNVISYFHARISEAKLKSPSAEEISELIETAARTWPPGRLKEFPDLKFQYEEETESQEFFCPYVWALIYRHTWIYWDEDKAHILRDYIIYDDEMEDSSVQVV
ncbi:14254_t:CDS:10 [Funneliformis geosporum]|uniref:Dymeclin n=1 Tax=Funneliformis geosporum TaxID=1117311 RepID=A0A9W4SJX6_9GLOM|nr:14254_t:CDS:10 [Funneliformis geosporum]